MPLREGGRQKVHIYFQFKFGINSLFKSKSKWVEVTGVASKRCWVQGIDICWFGVWDSGVRVEDNSTDRTFTLNQTIRFRFKSNNQFRFKSKPDKLKITRQFFLFTVEVVDTSPKPRQGHDCELQQLVSSPPPMALFRSHTKIENQPSGQKYT